MKKKLKIILIVLGVIVGVILLDTLQALVFDNNPIIKIREYYNGGDLHYKDKALLVDTYSCTNGTKDTTLKGTSYSCTKIDNFEIVDTSKNIKDFICAEALEEIYEDDKYIYYLPCIKSNYIEVRYDNAKKENIISALGNGHISITDLDKFNIEYIKKESNYTLKVVENENCNNNAKLYFEGDIKVYTYCVDNIYIKIDGEFWELKEYMTSINKNVSDSMNDIISNLEKEGSFWDGGTTMYKDGGTKKYTKNGITILKCKTIDGNNDVYIGPSSMEYEEGFCK